jgi:hypothetical protein
MLLRILGVTALFTVLVPGSVAGASTCESDADCTTAGDRCCINGCYACCGDEDCGTGQKCSQSGVCVAGDCTQDSDCGTGKHCSSGGLCLDGDPVASTSGDGTGTSGGGGGGGGGGTDSSPHSGCSALPGATAASGTGLPLALGLLFGLAAFARAARGRRTASRALVLVAVMGLAAAGCTQTMGRPVGAMAVEPIANLPAPSGAEVSAQSKPATSWSEFDLGQVVGEALGGKGTVLRDAKVSWDVGFGTKLRVEGKPGQLPPHQ